MLKNISLFSVVVVAAVADLSGSVFDFSFVADFAGAVVGFVDLKVVAAAAAVVGFDSVAEVLAAVAAD